MCGGGDVDGEGWAGDVGGEGGGWRGMWVLCMCAFCTGKCKGDKESRQKRKRVERRAGRKERG